MHKDLPDSAVAAVLGDAGEALHRRKVSGVYVCVCSLATAGGPSPLKL